MERISRWEWVGHAIKAGIRNKGRGMSGAISSFLLFRPQVKDPNSSPRIQLMGRNGNASVDPSEGRELAGLGRILPHLFFSLSKVQLRGEKIISLYKKARGWLKD